MEFDLDQSTSDAWGRFTDRLGEVVSHMDPGGTLTLNSLATSGLGHPPFVSFTCLGDRRILTLVSGNARPGDDHPIDDADRRQLSELGWEPPTGDDQDPGTNHAFVASQEDFREIATRAVTVLRDVFHVRHPAFLAPDQLAEVLAPRPDGDLHVPHFLPEDLNSIVPESARHLTALVREELVQILGYEPMVDASGDFAIRVGSAIVFVRCTPDAHEVMVFSPVVHDLEGRNRAIELLGDLNAEARYVRFLLLRDQVFASMSVLAYPFVPAHLHQALKIMTVVADEIDEELARRLKGRTSFGAVD